MKFFAENLQIFKKVAGPLFVLVILTNTIDQFLNLKIESALQSPLGFGNEFYLYGLLSILNGVVGPVVILTLALSPFGSFNSSHNIEAFLKKYLNQVFIETLRAWGKSLLWSLLLILPGIWKFIEFSLVPIVVTSSAEYEEGKLDALQTSTAIFRRHWVKILFILGLFHLFIPLILTAFFDSYRLIWKTPIASLVLSLLDTYLILISTQLLYSVFQNEVTKHESHV